MAGLLDFNDPMMQLAIGLLNSGRGSYGSFGQGLGQGLLTASGLQSEQQQRDLYRQQLTLQNQRLQQQMEQQQKEEQRRQRVLELMQPVVGRPEEVMPPGVEGPPQPATGAYAKDPTVAAMAQGLIEAGQLDEGIGLLMGPKGQGPTAMMQNFEFMRQLGVPESEILNRLEPLPSAGSKEQEGVNFFDPSLGATNQALRISSGSKGWRGVRIGFFSLGMGRTTRSSLL